MSVRIDKWLQVARIFKTRIQAVRACRLGRVTINGRAAKPRLNLCLEDRVEVQQGKWKRIFIVKGLRDKPIPKAEARTLYEDRSPPRPTSDLDDRFFPVLRGKSKGRPTKKERRQIERLKKSEPR
ncbi:RNA-binding S4 domain-containing protein [Acidobacteria bacterium AH-259-A15]|nr:RNA-binding S4 domain-containing protein [Acidobacteria bacterium AH-259-A15]